MLNKTAKKVDSCVEIKIENFISQTGSWHKVDLFSKTYCFAYNRFAIRRDIVGN